MQVVLNCMVFAKRGNKGKYGRQAALQSLMVGSCAGAQGLGDRNTRAYMLQHRSPLPRPRFWSWVAPPCPVDLWWLWMGVIVGWWSCSLCRLCEIAWYRNFTKRGNKGKQESSLAWANGGTLCRGLGSTGTIPCGVEVNPEHESKSYIYLIQRCNPHPPPRYMVPCSTPVVVRCASLRMTHALLLLYLIAYTVIYDRALCGQCKRDSDVHASILTIPCGGRRVGRGNPGSYNIYI